MNDLIPSTPDSVRRPSLPAGSYKHHILFCADQTNPKCASREMTHEVWEHLKTRLHQMGLAVGAECVYRSKVDCLRVCTQGPIAVVYPEGIWYNSVTADVLDRILQEHIVGGQPVEEYIFARNLLCSEGHSIGPTKQTSRY